jgi:hypothetical protein
MFAIFRQQPLRRAESWAALAACALLLAGCGPPTAEQGLKQAFKDNPTLKAVEIAPFEGTVTVDGKVSEIPGTQLLVILNDPKHPLESGKRPKLLTGCNADGHFAFTTNAVHDGVETGSYVLTFVQLHNLGSTFGKNKNTGLGPPDELKNLYNDPDKNAEVSEFKVEIKKPGITDAHYNLVVEGKEPVASPGPHAFTALNNR